MVGPGVEREELDMVKDASCHPPTEKGKRELGRSLRAYLASVAILTLLALAIRVARMGDTFMLLKLQFFFPGRLLASLCGLSYSASAVILFVALAFLLEFLPLLVYLLSRKKRWLVLQICVIAAHVLVITFLCFMYYEWA